MKSGVVINPGTSVDTLIEVLADGSPCAGDDGKPGLRRPEVPPAGARKDCVPGGAATRWSSTSASRSMAASLTIRSDYGVEAGADMLVVGLGHLSRQLRGQRREANARQFLASRSLPPHPRTPNMYIRQPHSVAAFSVPGGRLSRSAQDAQEV